MFSIHDTKFESFTDLIQHGFNVRTREALIKVLYDYLPKIFSGDIFIFLPKPLTEGEIEVEVPQFTQFVPEEKKLIKKIREHHKSGSEDYPATIDGWYVNPVKIKSDIIFVFAAEIKTLKKLNITEDQREDILSVIASLFLRISTMQDENERNIKAEKEKLRTQILSGISHDLKTPLSAIIGSLNLLVSSNHKLTDKKKKDFLETALSEANRLNNFITNILNMARIESGVVKAKMEWHDLDDLVNQTKKYFRHKHSDRILKINYTPDDIILNVDQAMFEKIMCNVLENAAKYSPDKEEIEISIERNDSLDFFVRDHGEGIPDDMLEKIFDKYTRIPLEDRKLAGTGLGLAISKSLATLQNADIAAFNHKDGGAVFKISYPEWRVEKPKRIVRK